MSISDVKDVEGLASCLDYFQTINEPFSNDLHKRYEAKFGATNPLSAAGGSTGVYRAIKLWEAAANAAGSVDRDAVAAKLDSAKIENGPGGGAEFVPGTRHLRLNMYIAVAEKGSFKVVDQSQGPVEPGECA